MKVMEYFCASPASVAISSGKGGSTGEKGAGRWGFHFWDRRRTRAPAPAPALCSPLQSPITTKPCRIHEKSSGDTQRKSCVHITDFLTPAGNSSRYLLGDAVSLDLQVSASKPDSEPEPTYDLVRARPDFSPSRKSAFASTRPRNQVVVLWVSLHCQGCEAKVRKHISKMGGVTSFSTDLATKKVTVIGDVTPLGVLASVSKVKNAQFWSSAPMLTTSSSSRRP